uniref:Uncharacterized protein n=1 Tax=Manihot esculenta TaxID=3983 RepID=A0A2C9VDS8_MANES
MSDSSSHNFSCFLFSLFNSPVDLPNLHLTMSIVATNTSRKYKTR